MVAKVAGEINDDYMRTRDVAKFVREITRAPSFGPLVRKIASDPSSHALAMDFINGVAREAPPELAAAASDVLKGDNAALNLTKSILAAVGAPPMLLSVLSAGALEPQAAPPVKKAR